MEKVESSKRLSTLDIKFNRLEKELERDMFSSPAPAFENDSDEAKKKRIEKSMKDFFYFDKTYFPSEYHRQGYYKPGVLHFEMFRLSSEPGIHWIGTFRNLAKSANLKKIRIWHLLSGRAEIGSVMMETLPKAQKFIKSIEYILRDNERIQKDFEVEIDISNEQMLRFSSKFNKGYSYYLPYSLQANAKGDNLKIERPDFMDFDDPETSKTNKTEANTSKLEKIIVEAYRSCKDGANMLGISNNMHPKCLFNKLKIKQEKGKINGLIKIYPYPVWSKEKTEYTPYIGSVWQNKYPAKTIDEMKTMINPQDDVEWSEAMCDPVLKSGHLFPRELLRTYKTATLPSDSFGAGYCDPNLSLKGKGDTTAIGSLLYSRNNDQFYVHKPKCKSYSNSDDLLYDFLTLFDQRINIMAMDGNVAQESIWTNNIRNFVAAKGIPYPPIMFCRYTVDMIAQHISSIYKSGKISFPEEWLETDEGNNAIEQLFAFTSKKENGVDDFPDWLICVYQVGMQLGMFIPNVVSGGNPYEVNTIGNASAF